jgi:serine/threonine-protein kinase RsbW
VENKHNKLELRILSHTKNLRTVREFIFNAATNFGFDDSITNKIVLAVDEACTNIIKHAYHSVDNKPIELSINTIKDTFEIDIRDYGDSFDPAAVKSPVMPEYIKKYNKGGLGMYLMRSLVDKIEYHNNSSQGNLVRLVKSK